MITRLFRHLRWRLSMWRHIYWPQFWYARQLPARVQSGPFRGMRYLRTATGSVVLPKLLGSYEQELHPVLESLTLSAYERCVDAGAAEGYYAVGLCWRWPGLHMIAFETTRIGRNRLRRLARLNGVLNRIDIRGHCSPEALQNALAAGGRNLLVMDVEGYEAVLLDPVAVPLLRQTDILVELHPETDPGLEQTLSRRLEASHRLERIGQQGRNALPEGVVLAGGLQDKVHFAMNEFRGNQFWLVARAKWESPA